MTLYRFLYCDCIHESAYATISIHKTKKGAETAMYLHKEQERQQFNEMAEGRSGLFFGNFGTYED